MMEHWNSIFGIGVGPGDRDTLQVIARALLVFVTALVMIRLGDRRFLSRKTAFDAAVGFILASMLARAINGSAPLVATLVGGFVIVMLHRLMAALSCQCHFFGSLIKGQSDLVARDGKILPEKLRANLLSEGDLLEDLRLNGKLADVSQVRVAYFERDGQISAVPLEKSGAS